MLTTEASIVRGPDIATGTRGSYRRLVFGPPEERIGRRDLLSDGTPGGRGESLLQFVQLSDLHTVDVESPGRFEFMEQFAGVSDAFHLVLPAHRSHELLHTHAVDALFRAVNEIGGSRSTGAPLRLVICTGDLTDNVQGNELERFFALIGGETVAPTREAGAYRGVQASDWPNPLYWHPDPLVDDLKRGWGFPTYPGLLERASQPFQAAGSRHPWLSVAGNHDLLVLGTALPTAVYERIVTGDAKAVDLPPDFEVERQLPRFVDEPECFLSGPSTPVPADTGRRPLSRRAFLQMHAARGAARHGFTPDNVETDTAYYVQDLAPHARLIVLDTTNPAGHYQGSLDRSQLAWLEERLLEVHSQYFDRDGRLATSGVEDRLVVIASHHGLDTLINSRRRDGEERRVLGAEVEALLHRFPNVALWVNGHVHRHTVTPRPDRSGRAAGFWEVTTGSLIDWPGQGRLVELVLNAGGTLSILCTGIDHDAHPDPRQATADGFLPALHRELAANDPRLHFIAALEGHPEDRTVALGWPLSSGLRRQLGAVPWHAAAGG
ncbi:MAG TPA: TIGR03767 family metallophosphoesterase [Chloroflexota bacterium]|nr:TIGR03767 family metallophosphoesterase [Chloroflexota bacterium]